jgi:hypothetical protein
MFILVLLADQVLQVWTELGDSIAKAYSGSGAMKADFTRTNKRTKAGLLEDGYKGALRYVKNNFFDGARQASVVSMLESHFHFLFLYRMHLICSRERGRPAMALRLRFLY